MRILCALIKRLPPTLRSGQAEKREVDRGKVGGGGLPLGDNLVGVVCGTFWQRFKSLAVISRAPHKAKSQRKREKKRIQ